MAPFQNSIRAAYRTLNGAVALAALASRRMSRQRTVYYGGALAGDNGGPLVKTRLLREAFPESRFGFSLVYLLSNALYLPNAVIAAIQTRGVPIVLNQNGVFYPAWFPDGWKAENERMAFAYHRASHVFWQSEFCRRCADRFLGVRDGGGEILFNAVDIDRFQPRQDAARNRPFRLLLTGKIEPSTGYRLLSSIDGVAAARRGGLDVVLDVAGGIAEGVAGDSRKRIEALGLTDAVRFLGPYTSADAPGIYRSADAYIMTKQNDPCPNVVIEALASGLPVVYSASGGVPELVGPDAGVGLPIEESFDRVVTPTPDAIAEGISRVMSGRETMATEARKRAVAHFALDAWIARHGAVFAKLIENGKAAS